MSLIDIKFMALLFVFITAPVTNLFIDSDLLGNVGQEMTISCIASGSLPEATIAWNITNVSEEQFEIQEEIKFMVKYLNCEPIDFHRII